MAKQIHNQLINRIHDKELLNLLETYVKEKKESLIDIGCGTKPYKQMLGKFVKNHIGVDHELSIHDKKNVDLVGTAYEIPVKDNSFDIAICTAVLEHLEEPEQAIRECYRVLNSNSLAIYSVPFIWHLHEVPRDFYRFTEFGLKYLFEKVGFEVKEIKALSGFWVTFGQLFVYYIYRFNRGPIKWLRIVDLIGLILQGLFYGLEKIDKAESWTWMYIIVAQKK